MDCLKDTLLLILFLFIFPIDLFPQAQPVQVKGVSFYFEPADNEVIISYDLVNFSPLEVYEVELSFIDGLNVVIRPVSVVGDIGKDIQGGMNKRIVWNVFNDVEILPVTASPVIQIISVNNKPIDPALALIMDKISREEEGRYHFKMQRDGILIGGVGCGVASFACNLKADGYIEEQNQAMNLEDYNLAGKNADRYYSISYVLGGVSAILVGYSLYQYIWGGKSKNRKTALKVGQGSNQGFSLSFTKSF